ncbi:MAG: LysM peptidoglycan-binding domain-containing protein [Roseovarius sp.]|nr:LysM peptidoglycan-binding domain-containing protein [Roseovarius sp.]
MMNVHFNRQRDMKIQDGNSIKCEWIGKPALLSGIAAITICLSGCERPHDLDGDIPGTRETETLRPEPDNRGIISYPNYQVALGQSGDTLASLANRIGVDAEKLARYNGMRLEDGLRAGEIVVLHIRVPEIDDGRIGDAGIDIAEIAGKAIDEATAPVIQTTELEPADADMEPVRHKVKRGETAFMIARLYNVSIRRLAEWNSLGPKFSIREGQYLLIPVAIPGQNAKVSEEAVPPGDGSDVQAPPSASKPLPDEETMPKSTEVESTAAPNLGANVKSTQVSSARMSMPVKGDIIREYSKGVNDGIDISAAPGSPVQAADSGSVAAITQDSDGNPIIVISHGRNLLTVYSNLGNVFVKKGDSVARGEKIADIPAKGRTAIHFQVRRGMDSLDPSTFLN